MLALVYNFAWTKIAAMLVPFLVYSFLQPPKLKNISFIKNSPLGLNNRHRDGMTPRFHPTCAELWASLYNTLRRSTVIEPSMSSSHHPGRAFIATAQH